MSDILDKEHDSLPDLYCEECGRKMKVKIEEFAEHSITGTIHKKEARYFCPSLWCRLVNYNTFICYFHYRGELLKNGKWKIIQDYHGD